MGCDELLVDGIGELFDLKHAALSVIIFAEKLFEVALAESILLPTLNTGHEIGKVLEANLTYSFSLNEQDPVNANLVDECKCDLVTLVEINHIQRLQNEQSLFLHHLLFQPRVIVMIAVTDDDPFLLGEGLLEYLLQGLDLPDCMLKLVLGMLKKESRVEVIPFHSLSEEGLETLDLLLQKGLCLFDSLLALHFLLVLGIIRDAA